MAAAGINSEWSRKFAAAATAYVPNSEWSRKFAAAAAVLAPNSGTEIPAAPNPDSKSRRRLAVATAIVAAVGPNTGTEILANTEILAAQAAVLDSEWKAANRNPEWICKFGHNSEWSHNFVTAVATAAQAAFVDKIEAYYLELHEKLFELLEDAKRSFVVEKAEITERLQKEKDDVTERLEKEKAEVTERLQKEKDEVTGRLQKEKDAITERLQKEKDEVTERLRKEKDEVTERLHKRRKRSLGA